MPELMTIKRVALGPHHLQPARIGVTIRGGGTTRPVPPFVALQIAHYPGGKSYYLFHIAKDGDGTDTLHESLEEALGHAEYLYGVKRTEWLDVNFPFGCDEHR
jgi:hypothetical protein